MGWWKKLKKKVSIKNLVKGAKKASRFLPGGDLINEGLDLLTKGADVFKTQVDPNRLKNADPLKRAAAANRPNVEPNLIPGFDNRMLLAGVAAFAALWYFGAKR